MKNRTYHIIFLLLLFSIVLLTSCNTSKNVAELNTNTDELFRYDSLNLEDTTTIATLSVDEFFDDDKLLALIHQGLGNNYSVRVAIERIKQSNADLMMAKAAKWPTVGVMLQDEFTAFSNGDNGANTLGYNSNQLSLGFNASWEIDVWGKLKSAKKASLAAWMNSHESLALVQTNLIANIARGYYNLLSLDEQLRITHETIRLMEESLETIKALKEAGMQNGAAVEQTSAQLYNTRTLVFDIENAIRQQENALCVLLGIKPSAIDRNALQDVAPTEKLDYGIPAQLLANRPDVRSAELNFRQAYHLTDVAQKNFYPSVRLSSAFFGYNGTDFSDLVDPKSIVANLVGNLTMPLFSQRRLKGNLAIAQSQQEQAALNFEETLLNAGQEVSNILYGFDSAIQKTDWRSKQITALNKAVEFNRDLLKAGVANYIEVLAAQQSLLNAQLNDVNEKLALINYSVDLYKALGGGIN